MAELTLHHYAISAFSERVRLAMGLRRLPADGMEVAAPH